MANSVYIACTLDGYIATPDGGLDWLLNLPNPSQSDFGFGDFMQRIDAIVMGRKTYEKVLGFESWLYSKKVFVLSHHLTEVDKKLEGKAEVLAGTPAEVVAKLKSLGHQNLYIDGGQTIQGFLKEDLIDEMIITRIPILLGKGIPLFAELDRHLYFSHQKTEILDGAGVKTSYLRLR